MISSAFGKWRVSVSAARVIDSLPVAVASWLPMNSISSAIWLLVREFVPSWTIAVVKDASPGSDTGSPAAPVFNTSANDTAGRSRLSTTTISSPFDSRRRSGIGGLNAAGAAGDGRCVRSMPATAWLLDGSGRTTICTCRSPMYTRAARWTSSGCTARNRSMSWLMPPGSPANTLKELRRLALPANPPMLAVRRTCCHSRRFRTRSISSGRGGAS